MSDGRPEFLNQPPGLRDRDRELSKELLEKNLGPAAGSLRPISQIDDAITKTERELQTLPDVPSAKRTALTDQLSSLSLKREEQAELRHEVTKTLTGKSDRHQDFIERSIEETERHLIDADDDVREELEARLRFLREEQQRMGAQ